MGTGAEDSADAADGSEDYDEQQLEVDDSDVDLDALSDVRLCVCVLDVCIYGRSIMLYPSCILRRMWATTLVQPLMPITIQGL